MITCQRSSSGIWPSKAGIAVPGDHTAALRIYDPPVIARVHEGSTVCDLRTVDPADDQVLADALKAAVTAT